MVKNSSKLEAVIAKNFKRSKSDLDVSRAWSKTRSSNFNHDKSREMNFDFAIVSFDFWVDLSTFRFCSRGAIRLIFQFVGVSNDKRFPARESFDSSCFSILSNSLILFCRNLIFDGLIIRTQTPHFCGQEFLKF